MPLLSATAFRSHCVFIPSSVNTIRQFSQRQTKFSLHHFDLKPKANPTTVQSQKFSAMSSITIPKTTRAVFQPDIQSTNLILTTLPLQPAKPNTKEHLIKVYATAPCNGELLWAKNFPSIMEPDRVAVPCNDLSGIVVTAPADSPFQPGTEIYTRTPAARTGNARDFTIAMTDELALKPKNLSW